MGSHFSALGGALDEMGARMKRWSTIVVASATAAALALGKLATTAAHSLDDLDDMAAATGTTTQKLEALRLTAVKAGDAGFEDIEKGLTRTTRAMGQAQIEAEKLGNVISFSGGKRDFSDPFKALDIDVTRFKDPIALLEKFARELDKESNAAIKASLGADVFGKSWARILPTMKNLRAEMAQSEKDIVAGGGFTSQQSIDQANKFLAALGKLEFLFGRLRDAAGAQLGAALTPAIEQLTAFVQANMAQISAFVVNAAGYIKALAGDLIRFFVLGQPGQQTEWGAAIINTLIYIQQTLIPGITTAFQTLMGFLNQVAGGINAIFGTSLTGGQVGMALAIGQVSGAFTTLTLAVSAFASILVPLLVVLGPTGWLVLGMVAVSAAIVTLTGQWGELTNAVSNAAKTIGNALLWLWNKLKDLGSAFVNMPALAGTGAAPMAAGGRVPGSGTGDTVPAMLTPGEFVNRKASVAKYGVGLFRALNAGAIPRGFFRGLGFALGGLVETPRGFADGGLATATVGGRPVHLHLGGNSFALSGSESVVGSLVTEAHRQRMRSAGTKPSWYGGR
jgi:hypothetical protein